MKDDSIRALSADNVHETAIAMMLAAPKSAAIADLPCGEGALAAQLVRGGYTNIVAGDIDTAQIKLGDEVKKSRIDLSRELDLPTAAFDVVFNIECIEHLENPYLLFRELARIVKPGGMLILSTPNIMSTNARSKYFSAGYFPWFIDLAHHWETLKADGFMGHIMPVSLSMIFYLAFVSGFEVETVAMNRPRRKPKLKDRLIAALIRRVSRRFYSPRVYELLTSDAALYGDILIMRLRRK